MNKYLLYFNETRDVCVSLQIILQISLANAQCTLCNGSQFAFLLWTELQHGVNDRKKRLPLAARLQKDELQQDVLQVLQVGHALFPLLVSL